MLVTRYTLMVHCGTTQFNSSCLFLKRTKVNGIYYIAFMVPVWNWFLLIVLAFTGGLGVHFDGHQTNKEEIRISGSDLERRWNTKEV